MNIERAKAIRRRIEVRVSRKRLFDHREEASVEAEQSEGVSSPALKQWLDHHERSVSSQ